MGAHLDDEVLFVGTRSKSAAREEHTTRDFEYYFDDGDCVIRVEDTVFRVHRFLLTRDGSAFADMFSLPPGSGTSEMPEGSSDANPIRLFGESAEDFRALLFILYALPPDLLYYNTSAANIPHLLTIASITHKYHFHRTSNWAISSAFRVLSDTYGTPTCNPSTASASLLARILEVALRCAHEPLTKLAEDIWAHRVLTCELHPRRALALADAHGLRLLGGAAYYAQLLEMEDGFQDPRDGSNTSGDNSDDTPLGNLSQPTPGAQDAVDEIPALTEGQRRRLLCGHWSLVRLWEQLRARAPVFRRPEGCTYHARGCLSTWGTVWDEAARAEETLARPPADVLGRLAVMEARLTADSDLQTALTPACRRRALLAVKEIIKETKEELAGHFIDLTVRPQASE
ncbi:hypothetical protein OBBRIDRAFT_791083 [Obba rivulosa]|uniref:BTB domain-containing protein n=1 Tax=Obba rivulosa TaxID=1052685 RepID=A0A8E2DLK1_9APHY|nr:hypothetical protein OBBRIDRAFT_791083 [Obba rivulosa]